MKAEGEYWALEVRGRKSDAQISKNALIECFSLCLWVLISQPYN